MVTGFEGGGGWNAIRYQILDPPKNQISDIRPPQKIKYQISRVRKNQISDPKKNHLSDITHPKKSNIIYQGTPIVAQGCRQQWSLGLTFHYAALWPNSIYITCSCTSLYHCVTTTGLLFDQFMTVVWIGSLPDHFNKKNSNIGHHVLPPSYHIHTLTCR